MYFFFYVYKIMHLYIQKRFLIFYTQKLDNTSMPNISLKYLNNIYFYFNTHKFLLDDFIEENSNIKYHMDNIISNIINNYGQNINTLNYCVLYLKNII